MNRSPNPGIHLNHAFLIDEAQKGFKEKLKRFEKDDRAAHLKAKCEVAPGDAYNAAYKRHQAALKLDPHTHLFTAEARNRVATGLGNPSPIEAGVTTLAPHGVPIIQGSSLKGAMLRVAIKRFGLASFAALKDKDEVDLWAPDATLAQLVKRFGWVEPGFTIPANLGILPIERMDEVVRADKREEARKLRFIQSLFGSVEQAGRFDLLNAWPVPGNKSFLMLDVVTCHHPEYYAGKVSHPSPMDQPVPVSFLSIRPKTKFLFGIRCEERLVETLKSLLCEAMREGLGAKTLKGYGVFSGLTPAK